MASLFVIRGNDQGRRYELGHAPARLGRDVSSTIQLHDTEVSRHHAEIRVEGDCPIVVDLDSSNGTFVNGRQIRQSPLVSGDHLRLGKTLMLFTAGLDDQTDLSESILIGGEPPEREASRIVQSIPQPEGSHIFDFETQLSSEAGSARARNTLHVMYRTALAVSRTQDIDQLLSRIMDLVFEWIDADRGCIMMLDSRTGVVTPKVHRVRQGIPRGQQITISKTILDYVAEKGEGVLTSDARRDQRWDAGASIVHSGVREAICVPMQGRYEMVGVIYVDTYSTPADMIRRGSGRFTEDHLKLMVAIAHQAALAVEDTRHYSALVQAERLAAIGQTVAALSHYIKNILQGINGGSYLIETGLSQHDEDIVAKGWRIVEKNQNRISALVLDMLTLSKEREPEVQPGSIDAVVGEVVELMQSRAAQHGVSLVLEPSEPIDAFSFDSEGIHRAVLNVMTNAIDAAAEFFAARDSDECEQDHAFGESLEGYEDEDDAAAVVRSAPQARPGDHETPEVHVAVRSANDAPLVRIIVEDNGRGVPPERVVDIFSPFVSSKKQGTGLGLPVSQKILREHNGRISVETNAPRGARFVLELPTKR